MEKYVSILEELKKQLENDLQAEHLVNNRVPHLQETADRIIARKKSQIDALENVISYISKK